MPDSFAAGLNWVDVALLVVLLVSTLVGAVRGLVYEALSLGAWVIAYFTAPLLAPLLLRVLPRVADDGWRPLAALVLAFVLVLVVVALSARLLRTLLHATPLQVPDRLMGAGFGLVRGVLLCLLFAVLISLTPWRQGPTWQHSRARPVLAAVMQGLSPLLPAGLHDWVRARPELSS